MEDFTTFICFNLKATNRKVERFLTVDFQEFGINVAQSFIILCLLDQNGSTLSEISNRANIESSSLTTMVDKLEDMNLLRRQLDRKDRRVIRVFLTDKGRDLAERVLEAGTKFNQLLKNALDGEEIALLKSLATISKTLEEAEKKR